MMHSYKVVYKDGTVEYLSGRNIDHAIQLHGIRCEDLDRIDRITDDGHWTLTEKLLLIAVVLMGLALIRLTVNLL